MANTKTILVAPLHWGLGHATRCIPIINSLLENQYNVIIASDGGALRLLQKEFPKLESIELPSYNISYPKKGKGIKWKLLQESPKIKKTISEENKIVKQLVFSNSIQGIISDNRLGVRSDKIPSVYITHQLNVLSGFTTYFSTIFHQYYIKKFDECWVPDFKENSNLSGNLGHLNNPAFPIKYLGILSRMNKIKLPTKFDFLVLLSGPEPQRTLLEKKILKEFKGLNKRILIVQGIVENVQKKEKIDSILCYNYMESKELEKAINESEAVISRSGYTSLMDLTVLQKKAFFIPTPGQYEQEYLAKRMKKLQLAPYCKQEDFSYEKLAEIDFYKGMSLEHPKVDDPDLFSLFECE